MSWSPDTQLTNHAGIDKAPSAMQAVDGSIWVAWASYRTGETMDFEIFYKYTYDYGDNWSSDTLLTNQTGYDDNPSIIQARDGSIFVFWGSDRVDPNDSTNDLFYEISGDMGQTWSKPLSQRGTQLTTDTKQDVSSSATNIDNGTIWVVWSSNRVTTQGVEFEVFYKTSSVIPAHDVAITDVTASSTKVYQGNSIDIYVEVKNEGTFNETFNVIAYYNETTIETQTITDLTPDNTTVQTFTWNVTTDILPSYYTMSATAEQVTNESDIADNFFTNGVIHVKIRGDIDGNEIVDIYDALLVRKHIWHEPTSCPLGLEEECHDCDIDDNGIIDIYDALIVRANYWRTSS